MWNPRLSDRFNKRLIRVIGQMDLSPCNGCDECGLRCAAGVQVARQEVDSVRRFIDESPDRDSIERVLAQDKTVDLGDGVTVKMCRYRDMERGGCAVYPARPLVCRLLGHVEWMPCPIEKFEVAVKTPDALELLDEYSNHERHTFEGWDEVSAEC